MQNAMTQGRGGGGRLQRAQTQSQFVTLKMARQKFPPPFTLPPQLLEEKGLDQHCFQNTYYKIIGQFLSHSSQVLTQLLYGL